MTVTGPLKGIRVLDFTHVLSGPFGSTLLGDMGADIIKIELEKRSKAVKTTSLFIQHISPAYVCYFLMAILVYHAADQTTFSSWQARMNSDADQA